MQGFSSSLRDWADEETGIAREVAEAAMSHVIGDKAAQAYRRGDALERRRVLMAAWTDYLTRRVARKMVALRAGSAA